ncbi:MAG: hypothetical protein WEE64_08545, partial [Dehalococcoidia bacterium]
MHQNVRKLTVWALLVLPLVAVGVAVALMVTWGSNAQANTVTPELSIAGVGLNCDTDPATGAGAKCNVPVGTMFTVQANVDKLAGLTDVDMDTNAGYNGFQIRLLTSAELTLKNRATQTELGPAAGRFWPDCGIPAENKAANDYQLGCNIGIGGVGSIYTGKVAEVDYNCTTQGAFSVAMPNGAAPNSHVTNESNGAVPDGTEIDTLAINCTPPSQLINVNVVDAAVPGKKLSGSCVLIAVDMLAGSPPAQVNQPIDVVSDNNANATCDGIIGGPLSDSNAAVGRIDVSISGALRIQNGDSWHAQQVATDAKHLVDNTKYACDLSVGKCTVNISNVRIAGNGFVNFNDTVTGLPLAGQCVDVSPPLTTICDNNVAPGAAGADLDPAAGVIHFTQPIGVYTVTYNPVNQPSDRLVKAPLAVACDLSGTSTATQTCNAKYNFNPTIPFNLKTPTLQNLFLTAQGAKLPPSTCAASTNVQSFTHTLSNAPTTADPKDPSLIQQIGGFEMDVLFDEDLICVNLAAGAYFTNTAGGTCFIDDKDDGLQPDGLARIGCVVLGKPTSVSSSLELAVITVRPQPELYSLITADQDNGVIVQVLNSGCNLADMQGHPIKKIGCDDSELTIRYLEGDVNGDCAVNVRDEQLLAFRWGAKIGSLLYNDRFDLEPSGQINSDGDIDIKDVQFVYGRHGSICTKAGLPPQTWPA